MTAAIQAPGTPSPSVIASMYAGTSRTIQVEPAMMSSTVRVSPAPRSAPPSAEAHRNARAAQKRR